MTSRNRTPSQLVPYLELPPELSLTLLTGTLSCSTTWLTARFAASVLNSTAIDLNNQRCVIFASWTKSEVFWREQLKRVGVDLRQCQARFLFVDRLSGALRSPSRSINDELIDVEKHILSAAQECAAKTSSRALIVLDSPDVLLATHSTIDISQLDRTILRLRTHASVHSIVLSCFAGLPLISPEDRMATPLETANAGFLLQQAHSARQVISVRELATGSARDVTGIIRITKGGDLEDDDTSTSQELEKRYLVQRDAMVRFVE